MRLGCGECCKSNQIQSSSQNYAGSRKKKKKTLRFLFSIINLEYIIWQEEIKTSFSKNYQLEQFLIFPLLTKMYV